MTKIKAMSAVVKTVKSMALRPAGRVSRIENTRNVYRNLVRKVLGIFTLQDRVGCESITVGWILPNEIMRMENGSRTRPMRNFGISYVETSGCATTVSLIYDSPNSAVKPSSLFPT